MVRYTSPQQKLEFLNKIIQKVNAQNILIFDNKKTQLQAVLAYLQGQGYKAELVCKVDGYSAEPNNSAQMIEKKIKDFMAGKYQIMLTTNLLSRGIDMRKVTLVINYTLPIKIGPDTDRSKREVDLETYLHRVGRTGRFGDSGIALNFVNSEQEQSMLDEITNYYKNSITELNLDNLNKLNEELAKIDKINDEKRKHIENII